MYLICHAQGSWHLPGQFNFAEKRARDNSTFEYMSPESYKYCSEEKFDEDGKDIEKLISQNLKGWLSCHYDTILFVSYFVNV